ncbi:MAG: hypothetical protein JSU74_03840 [Candidatus Zixiibacteriota bacterium]|nr:MAG: hypothetical protein JSU74_03840 [candidate division Zixibacteria bacterium]
MESSQEQKNSPDVVGRALGYGILGGLIATIVMDLVMVGLFVIMARPATVFFAFIGDATGAFFTLIGFNISVGATLGTVLHYVLGLLFGLIFGAIAPRWSFLRSEGAIVWMVVAVVYVQILSLGLLIPTTRLLEMTRVEVWELLSLSVFVHSIWGVVLGIVAKRGCRTERINHD